MQRDLLPKFAPQILTCIGSIQSDSGAGIPNRPSPLLLPLRKVEPASAR
jgi:hypothetical protein